MEVTIFDLSSIGMRFLVLLNDERSLPVWNDLFVFEQPVQMVNELLEILLFYL